MKTASFLLPAYALKCCFHVTCPPQFYLYEPAGYYDRTHGKMKFDVIEKAKKGAPLGNLSMDNELHYNDRYPAVRAWNLSIEEIRREGALFNMYRGALFSGIDIPMVLLLWPGYGASRCGFHYGCMPPGSEATTHTHPVSDECIVNWIGSGLSLISGEYIATGPLDVVLAPCGVQHGGKIPADAKGAAFPRRLCVTTTTRPLHAHAVLQGREVFNAAL